MGRVEGKIATGRTCLIEGTNHSLKGTKAIKLLASCFGQFFYKCLLPSIQPRLCINDTAQSGILWICFLKFFLNWSILETGCCLCS